MANRILTQTQAAAGCGTIVGCSGATLVSTPQAREATKDGTPGGSELTVTVTKNASAFAGVMFQSADNEPGKATWEAGDWVIRLNVTAGQESVTWVGTYVCRFDNACGSLATVGSLTGQSISFSTTGVKQMTVAGAEQSANLSDEIYIVLLFSNSNEHSAKAFGFTPDQNIDSPIVLEAEAQTLIPDGIVSLENFGNAKANLKMYPSAIESLEAHGTPNLVNLILLPGGIESLEGFGNGKLNHRLFPDFVPTGEGHGTPKFVLKLLPPAIGSEEAFGDAVVKLVQSLYPDAIASLEGFGDAKLNLRLLLSSIASLEGFGTSKLNMRLLMQAIASGEAFGEPTVSLGGGITLSPDGIASLEGFGSARLNLRIFPEGIANPEGIVGLWHLDEGSGMVAYDDSGQGNNGDLINMEEEDWVDGKIGKALQFDGAFENVRVPSLYNTAFPQTTGTIEFWVNGNFSEQGHADSIFDRYDSNRNHIFVRCYAGALIQICAQKANEPYVVSATVSIPPIRDNEWNHFAITYDTNTGPFKIYHDAILVYNGTISDPNWVPNQQQVFFGYGFQGLIDEIRIYNRVLSLEEIEDLKSLGPHQLNLRLYPSGIESLEGFGTAFINLQQTVLPSGIVSVEIVESPQLNFVISPDGITSLEAFGFDSIIKLIAQIFQVTPRDKVFKVDPREKTLQVKPRNKIFTVDRRN